MSEHPYRDPMVRWITPELLAGELGWREECEVTVETEEYLRLRGVPKHRPCAQRAKVDFRGKLLCTQHAKAHALRILAGPRPSLQSLIITAARIGERRD